MTLDEVAGHFQNVRPSGSSRSARCPCHEDNRNSLSLSNGDKSVVVLCHACGKERTKDILAAVGLSFSDLFYENGNGHAGPPFTIVNTYDYLDESGKLLFQVCRTSTKKFPQRRPDGEWGIKGVRRVLYRLVELLKADPTAPVWIVEGEKDADRLRTIGLVATTNPGGAGAGNWKPAYNATLKGRHVVVIPDNDPPGRTHADEVARNLYGIAATVKIVNLPGLPDKGDVSDWLSAGHTADELQGLAEAATEWTTDDLEIQKHIDSGVANMERLVAQHHPDARYLNKVGWYSWDGRRFAPDAEAELVRRAIRTVRAMYHEAPAIEDKKERESFLSHIRRSESEPEIRRMIQLAQSHEKTYVATTAELDRDPVLLNLHNGTLDLHARELHPHRRDELISKLAGCAYDPKGTCPTWDTFLETVFDGDQDMIGFVQRLAGYCLTGEVREHVLPILWGDGSNGKTTFIETLLNLLGEYGTPAPADLLVVRKHKDHPTELMVLLGARLATTDETPRGAYLNESLVKHLTGNDTISARHVFKDFVKFKPTHKLIMATNHKPVIQGADLAIWRRLLLVPFTVTIPEKDRDVHLVDKLALELPGILNWAVQGCSDWQDTGLKPPKQVQAATDAYRQESDHFPPFLEEACVKQPFARVEKGTMFMEYTRWCERNGESPMPKVELGRRLMATGANDEKSHGRRFWTGIGLVAKDNTP